MVSEMDKAQAYSDENYYQQWQSILSGEKNKTNKILQLYAIHIWNYLQKQFKDKFRSEP